MTVFPFPELDGEKEAEYEIFPINLTRMLLHTQGQTLPYLKFALSFRSAKIPPVVREQVICGSVRSLSANTNWYSINRRPCALEQARKCLRS